MKIACKLILILLLLVWNVSGVEEHTAWVFPGMLQDKIAGEETSIGITNATVLEVIPLFLAEDRPQFEVAGWKLNVGNYFKNRVTNESLYYYDNTTMEIIENNVSKGDALIFHSMMADVAKHLISSGRLDPSKYKIVFIEGSWEVPVLGDKIAQLNESWASVQDMRPGSEYLSEINMTKVEQLAQENHILEIHGKITKDLWWPKYVPLLGADMFRRTSGATQIDFPEVAHVQLLRNRAVIQTTLAYLNDPLSFSNFFKQIIKYYLFKKTQNCRVAVLC